MKQLINKLLNILTQGGVKRRIGTFITIMKLKNYHITFNPKKSKIKWTDLHQY